MTKKEIQSIFQNQKKYFFSGKTKEIDFRIECLKKLKEVLISNENLIYEALYTDLKKSPTESYNTEFGAIIEEINFAIKNIKKWTRAEKVKTPLLLMPAKSSVLSEPYGVCLIIGAWNYPFALSFCPLIGSIAAGNCAIIKPSEVAPNSSKIIAKIIQESFNKEYISVIEGNAKTTTLILEEKLDYIFFTGGTEIGKIIAENAAKKLIPYTLELGGKSPCIVEEDADIEMAAKRIVWGKFLNAGQTCIAPDYVLANNRIKPQLNFAIKKNIIKFYGSAPEESPDYPRIINKKHFERLEKLIKGNILFGGKTKKNDLYISPTIIDNVKWSDEIMKDEIFGPLLPILEYDSLASIVKEINDREKPLALYIFAENKWAQEYIIKNTSSGSVCVNATILQTVNPNLPFGGVGNSGIGSYHGKHSFDTFSHKKAIMSKSSWPELDISYPPYKGKLKILKKIWGNK
ncbi:aldehyde dehydrogenase [bacterium]|nr:aldehyde dehydrogenase [bacterium]